MAIATRLAGTWPDLTLMGRVLPGPIKNMVGFGFKNKKPQVGLGFIKTRPEPGFGPNPVASEITKRPLYIYIYM